MLLKEYGLAWPPNLTIGDASLNPTIPPKADLDDKVLNVKNRRPGELEISLRRSRHSMYTVLLPVPSSIQQRIIFDIVRKKNMTLREVGELAISYITTFEFMLL
jgi:hypothetical protein